MPLFSAIFVRLSLFCHFSSESSFHQKKPFNFRVKLLLLGLVETEGNPKLKSRKKKSFNWPLHCPSLKQRKRRSRSTVQRLLCFKVHPLHLRYVENQITLCASSAKRFSIIFFLLSNLKICSFMILN